VDGLANGVTEACTRDTNEPSEVRLKAASVTGRDRESPRESEADRTRTLASRPKARMGFMKSSNLARVGPVWDWGCGHPGSAASARRARGSLVLPAMAAEVSVSIRAWRCSSAIRSWAKR
jgi:hypothetical protein